MTTEDKLWLPPLSPKAQKKLNRLQKKPFFERVGFTGKTLWDLIPLFIQLLGALAIPVAIAIGTAYFSTQQNQTSTQIARINRQRLVCRPT